VQARIDAGEAEGIVFAKLDRLGRGLVGLGHLLRWGLLSSRSRRAWLPRAARS
jgi:hypothetical protein